MTTRFDINETANLPVRVTEISITSEGKENYTVIPFSIDGRIMVVDGEVLKKETGGVYELKRKVRELRETVERMDLPTRQMRLILEQINGMLGGKK